MFYTVINHKIAFYNLIHSKEEKNPFCLGLVWLHNWKQNIYIKQL